MIILLFNTPVSMLTQAINHVFQNEESFIFESERIIQQIKEVRLLKLHHNYYLL